MYRLKTIIQSKKNTIILLFAFIFASLYGCTTNNNYKQVTSPAANPQYNIGYSIHVCADSPYGDFWVRTDITEVIASQPAGTGMMQSFNGACVAGSSMTGNVYDSGTAVSITVDCSAMTSTGYATKIKIEKGSLVLEAYDMESGITHTWSNTEEIIGPLAQTSTASVTVFKILP